MANGNPVTSTQKAVVAAGAAVVLLAGGVAVHKLLSPTTATYPSMAAYFQAGGNTVAVGQCVGNVRCTGVAHYESQTFASDPASVRCAGKPDCPVVRYEWSAHSIGPMFGPETVSLEEMQAQLDAGCGAISSVITPGTKLTWLDRSDAEYVSGGQRDTGGLVSWYVANVLPSQGCWQLSTPTPTGSTGVTPTVAPPPCLSPDCLPHDTPTPAPSPTSAPAPTPTPTPTATASSAPPAPTPACPPLPAGTECEQVTRTLARAPAGKYIAWGDARRARMATCPGFWDQYAAARACRP